MIIHFIQGGNKAISKVIHRFAKAHSFSIDIHLSIEDFLSSYSRNRPQNTIKKFEDFQEWIGRFHLVIGYWETREDWKGARQDLRTWDPRIVKRLLNPESVSIKKQFESILDVNCTKALSFESLKNKYLQGLKRKFESVIEMTFHRFMQARAKHGQTTHLAPAKMSKVVKDPRQAGILRLMKVLSAFRERKKEDVEKMEFRSAFPILLWGNDNESEERFADRWFKVIREFQFQPSDYLLFFDHCPFCLSDRIRVSFFKSPHWTWAHLCGRAGWIVQCEECRQVLLSDLVVMS